MAADLPALCRAVLEGSFVAVGPIMDHLEESGDPRLTALSMLVQRMVESLPALEDFNSRLHRRRLSQEELAFRRDNQCFHLWENFAVEFQQMFWLELVHKPDMAAFQRVEDALGTVKQATRLNSPHEDTEDMMEQVEDAPSGMVRQLTVRPPSRGYIIPR